VIALHGYEVALFLHICGAVALFSTIALILGPVAMARRAPSAPAVFVLARTANRMRWLLPAAAIWLFLAASYMVSKEKWWSRSWVSGAMLILLLLLAIHLLLIAPRVAALTARAEAAPEGSPSRELQQLSYDPLLWIACQVLSTAAVGAIALMVFKPDGAGTAGVLIVSLGLGLLAGIPGFMRARRVGG
jgi:uncharacterized membrane protein